KLRLSGYFLKLSNRRHFRSPRGPLLCEPLRTLRLSVIFIPSSFLTFNLQLSTLNCFYPLTPIIPVHPRHSPVSPIIPVHTQKQGGWGCLLQDVFAYNSFVFHGSVNHTVKYNCRPADIPVSARQPRINLRAGAGAKRHNSGRSAAWRLRRILVPWQWKGCAQNPRRRRGPWVPQGGAWLAV